MKKMKYPPRGSAEFKKITDEYRALYAANLPQMEMEWSDWKQRHRITTIDETIEDILLADVKQLADLYDRFKALPFQKNITNPLTNKSQRSPEYIELDNIFKYERKYDAIIANFFIGIASDIHVSSCYYCDMAYVNAYTLSYPRVPTPCARYEHKRQFDVDHFLPKTECPILALSLFNFIPSCQVCNSRIKRTYVIGANKNEWEKFNPAGEYYSIDSNVRIRLRMWRKPNTTFRHKGDYYIYFHCKNGFRKAVDFFRLEERYEFHKVEAMRIRNLKAKYPQSTIKRISKLLGKSESEIREDLFHGKYLSSLDRCFSKLTRDMLK